MEKIRFAIRDDERAYYGSKDIEFQDIVIKGPKDGESAFKESRNISISTSSFYLRYPFWHNIGLTIEKCDFYETCRAPLWYCKDVNIQLVGIKGVKALRECENVSIKNADVRSDEFSWRVKNIKVDDCHIETSYGFFESKDVEIDNMDFVGKYSFQYNENLHINHSTLDTKDAFWHVKNGKIENTTIKGEYFGWYSENLTLINCKIIGTQPFCYCKNLRLIDCEIIHGDLAFENTEVYGNVIGTFISIKNPYKGNLHVDRLPEIIEDEHSWDVNNEFQLIEND